MQPKVEMIGDVAVVLVPCEHLAMGTEMDFKTAMGDILASYGKVVLDLQRVQFIDSSGCAVIMDCLKRIRAAHAGDLKLCQVNPPIRTIFDVLRLRKICDILETRDDAVRAFGTGETDALKE